MAVVVIVVDVFINNIYAWSMHTQMCRLIYKNIYIVYFYCQRGIDLSPFIYYLFLVLLFINF